MKYNEDLVWAQENLKEIKKKMIPLKKKKSNALDKAFHDLHDKVFQEIDCLECANCCKTTSPIFRQVDIDRIAKKFKQSSASFESQYLKKDEEGDWVLQSSPCTFLNPDNTCFIYDVRPQACREYPHTNRKRMGQILKLTEKNAVICPAVSKILQTI